MNICSWHWDLYSSMYENMMRVSGNGNDHIQRGLDNSAISEWYHSMSDCCQNMCGPCVGIVISVKCLHTYIQNHLNLEKKTKKKSLSATTRLNASKSYQPVKVQSLDARMIIISQGTLNNWVVKESAVTDSEMDPMEDENDWKQQNFERNHGSTEFSSRTQQDPMDSRLITIQDEQVPITDRTKRVATLDVFRGLTIAVMILVDDAGGEWQHINHSPWNGCTLADFVMPFFLFIVGVAIALALKKISKITIAVKKVIARTLKLLFWGIILQGGYSHAPDDLSYGVDMKKIRWCGILQRIALAYLVVALVEIATTKTRLTNLPPVRFAIFKFYRWQWLAGLCVFIIYFAIVYGLYVPDWHFILHNEDSTDNGRRFTVKCGVRGHLSPPCNAVGYVDRKVLGINHLYHRPQWRRSKDCTKISPREGSLHKDAPAWCHAPFEPEGILSSISAIQSTIIGVHYGHILVHFKGHVQRLKHWVTMGFGLFVLGIILHFTDAIPLNKQLYSFSYVCFTAGAAGIVFSAFYLLIDVWGIRMPFMLLEYMGMNAMLIFVMAAEGIFPGFVNGWYYESPNNTLVYWIQKHVFINVWQSRRVGILLYVLFAEILFWGIVAGILHLLGIHWKL